MRAGRDDLPTDREVRALIERALRAILTAHGLRSPAGRLGEPPGGQGARENPAEARLVAAISGEALFTGCSEVQLRLALLNWGGAAGYTDTLQRSSTGHAVPIGRRPRYLGYPTLARLAGLRSAHDARAQMRDLIARVARTIAAQREAAHVDR